MSELNHDDEVNCVTKIWKEQKRKVFRIESTERNWNNCKFN